MNSNFDFNIQALRNRYPSLAEQLTNIKDDGTVRVVPTRFANTPTCYVKTKDNEWLIHSRENPRKEAEFFAKVVMRDNLKNANTIVFLGLGMGYYLEQICITYGHLNPNLIIIENNIQLFKKFLENQRPMVSRDGKLISIFEFEMANFIIGVPHEQSYFYLYDIIHNSNRTSFSTFNIVEHPIIIRYNKEYYKPLSSEIHRICYDVRSSYGNDPEDSWIGIDHMLKNLDIISNNPGAERVANKFKGVPAVIVATGPSLNKNIHLLPKIKNKCVFMAADASLNTFLKYDPMIKPDIVCCLERNLSTKNHFAQIPEDKKDIMKEIYLAACPVIMPEVYREWKGDRHMVIFRDFAHFKWLGLRTLVLNTGKSVTNMAFKIAEAMGCDPIILVGQDLAYAADGQSHVTGADHARDGLAASPLKQQKVKVIGNNGQMLDSLDTWVGMLKRFEFDIAKVGKRYTVINATEGGALIKGTEVMTLQEAMDKYLKEDIATDQRLKEMMLPLDQNEITSNMNAINFNVTRGIEFLSNCICDLDMIINEIEGAFPEMMNGNIVVMQNVMQHADKIKEKILANELCYLTIMHVLQSWCMGRDTLLRGLDHYVPKEEIDLVRCLLIFEFFYGLRILFNLVYNGVKKDYYG